MNTGGFNSAATSSKGILRRFTAGSQRSFGATEIPYYSGKGFRFKFLNYKDIDSVATNGAGRVLEFAEKLVHVQTEFPRVNGRLNYGRAEESADGF